MLFPRYLAAFLCAAGLTAAGLAQGAAADDAEALVPSTARSLVSNEAPTESALPQPSAQSWPARVAARLDELSARRKQPREGRAPSLAGALDRVLAADLEPGNIAIHVRDLDTGEVLFDRRGDQHLNPASNQKLLTAHAAIELLGPDYRFETRAVLDGDAVYLVGEGDPSLQLADLHQLASRLQAAAGAEALSKARRIVVDETAFSSQRFAPGVRSRNGESAYLAPTGALSLNFNTVEIRVNPGSRRGAPADVELFPPSAAVEIRNHATTQPGSLHLRSYADGDRTVVEVHGAIAPDAPAYETRRRIHAPAHFAGEAFAAVLEQQGIQAGQLRIERGSAPRAGDGALMAVHRSRPLVELLASPLKYSNNFATEQVLRTLAWRSSGQPGDWEAGRQVLHRFAEAIVHDPDALRFVNGSGLSRVGRATPAALVDLIALAGDEGSASQELLTSYAGFGREGTLSHRLGRAAGRVRAKTGTLAGVSALSGLVSARDGGRRLAFSILVNGRHAQESRATQDEAVAVMLAWVEAH